MEFVYVREIITFILIGLVVDIYLCSSFISCASYEQGMYYAMAVRSKKRGLCTTRARKKADVCERMFLVAIRFGSTWLFVFAHVVFAFISWQFGRDDQGIFRKEAENLASRITLRFCLLPPKKREIGRGRNKKWRVSLSRSYRDV